MLFYIRKFFSYISLYFFKGALSDKDIRRLLGLHIFIYPFKKENLKASSYNLTASKCAFVKEGGEGKQQLIVKEDSIIIPAGKTAIVETQESIYVSRWITGTYHSRVKLVNKGIGHIGTTLDSCFWGISAIALQNTMDHDITIKVGSPIVTIMFYVLKSRSSGSHDNFPGRIDDNIRLDIENFYPFKDDKKTITTVITDKVNKDKLIGKKSKIKLIKDIKDKIIGKKFKIKVIKDINDKKINDESIIIFDIEKPVCKNCINCNEKDNCGYKLLKNINEEKEKRKRIIEELRIMKSQPWITSKEGLIKKVKLEIKKENVNKDIAIYSIIILLVAFAFIVGLSYFAIKYNTNTELGSVLKVIIGVIVPTAAIVIGMIANYKKKFKGE